MILRIDEGSIRVVAWLRGFLDSVMIMGMVVGFELLLYVKWVIWGFKGMESGVQEGGLQNRIKSRNLTR